MKQRNSLINDMTEGPLLKQLAWFSIPVVIGNILQSCYTIVDMIVVGKFIGADGLSAVGIAGILQNLLMMAAMGLGFGGQILLSQQIGAGKRESLQKSVGTFMTITFICAIVFGAAGFLLTDWLLNILNTPAEVYAQTKSYYLVCCFGMIFICGYNCVGSILRGLGESRIPTIFIMIAGVFNIGLDCILIGVFKMNVEGAALATVISQGISFIISLIYLCVRRESLGFAFSLRSLFPDSKTTVAIMSLSFPIILYGFVMSVSSIFVNSNVNSFGVAASAVDGIGTKLNMIANAISMGLATGGGGIIGQCFGAGKLDRIRKVYGYTIMLSIVIWAITAAVLVMFSKQVFQIFTSDQGVLAMSRSYMLIAAISYFGMSTVSGSFALFEGIGNTKLEMICGSIENLFVKIGLATLLSGIMGLYGYWLGSAIATLATPLVGSIYFLSNIWTKRKAILAE